MLLAACCMCFPANAISLFELRNDEGFDEVLEVVAKKLNLVFPKESGKYYEEDEFYSKFFGVSGWAVVEREGKKKDYLYLYSSRLNRTIKVHLVWTKNPDDIRLTFFDLFLGTYSQWYEIDKDYAATKLGDYGIFSKHNDRAYFVHGNVCVSMRVMDWQATVSFSEFSNLVNALVNIIEGKSDFFPEDTPEFVEIRKAYEAELVRRRRIADEESAKREREWKEQQRKKKIENLKTFAVKPEQERDAYKKLETRFELLKNHLKPKSVPAGMHDPDAWKKLSQKTVPPLFKKYKFYMNEWQEPLLFGFNVWRDDPEIKKTKPKGTDYDVEIAHAKTFEDAWDWALYFRLKYSEDTEQRARLTMKQLARATHQNAFPNLGDLNISWRGRMTSSFYPEEKSAESLIIFIRGTTTVCVRSCYSDSSALPLARLLDKQLLEGDASRAVEFYLPENF